MVKNQVSFPEIIKSNTIDGHPCYILCLIQGQGQANTRIGWCGKDEGSSLARARSRSRSRVIKAEIKVRTVNFQINVFGRKVEG